MIGRLANEIDRWAWELRMIRWFEEGGGCRWELTANCRDQSARAVSDAKATTGDGGVMEEELKCGDDLPASRLA